MLLYSTTLPDEGILRGTRGCESTLGGCKLGSQPTLDNLTSSIHGGSGKGVTSGVQLVKVQSGGVVY
jgi:hypothetical protein